MKFQSLRQVFMVTEWRDGCVYKTKPVGYAFVTLDHSYKLTGNLIIGSPSTDVSRELGIKSMRRVDDSTPDFVVTTLDEIRGAK